MCFTGGCKKRTDSEAEDESHSTIQSETVKVAFQIYLVL